VVEGIRRKAHKSIERGARHWARVNQLMLDDAERLQRFHLIKYEQLVATPSSVLPPLAQFLGLPLGEVQRGFEQYGVQDMNAASRRRLTQDEIAAITHETAPLLAKLGYAAPT
jgi:hypothetical protein